MVSVALRPFAPLVGLARASSAGFKGVVLALAWLATALTATLAAPGEAHAADLPVITSITPDNGVARGGQFVQIRGVNLAGATAVKFDGVPVADYYQGEDSVIGVMTPSHAVGPAQVTVETAAGASAPFVFTYINLPIVTTINPSRDVTAGGVSVNVDGENFTPQSDVLFGGVSATSVTFVNSNLLIAVAPPHAAGFFEVTVVTEIGSSVPSSAYNTTFAYYAVPVVESLSPARGTGGIRVDIHGQNFTASSEVRFGDAVVFTNFVDAENLWVYAPFPANGGDVVDVVVTTQGGTSQTGADSRFTYFSAPTIESVTPDIGSPGKTVTIKGAGFTSNAVVSFGGANSASVIFVSETELKAVTPFKSPGNVNVVVQTDAGTSEPATYTYATPPVINATSPALGQPGVTIAVTGQHFTADAEVTVAGVAAPEVTFIDSSHLQVKAPEAPLGTTGPIVVTTVGGPSEAPEGSNFRYAGPPSITSLEPATGPVGTSVTVHGDYFFNIQSVTINGVSASVSVRNGQEMQVQIPASAATGHLVIQGEGGVSAQTAASLFTVLSPPVVTSLSRSSGTQQGGDTVVLTGKNFTGVNLVRFGSKDAASFTIDSDTQITAVTPADFAWSVDITLHNAIGWSQGVQWTYVASPQIDGITPHSGHPGGGTTVTIEGTHLENVTSVMFGSTPATSFQVMTPFQLQAVSPAGTGEVAITVADAFSANLPTSAAQFTYSAGPEVMDVSPNMATIAGGGTVTLTGSSFTGATAVKFGANAAAFTVVSDTQITATVPAASAEGNVNVTVTTPGSVSAATSYNAFVYVETPTVTSVSPSTGSNTAGGPVTINGTGFSQVTEVKFGSAQAAFYVMGPTQIIANAPQDSSVLGQVDITVTNPAGMSATSAADRFTFTQGPSVASVSPNRGPMTGGTEVTLTGTGFTGVTQVTFFSAPAQSFTVVSPTEIRAVTPAVEFSGPVSVVVVTDSGPTDSNHSGAFTFVEPPYAYDITPTAGPTSGGTAVEIKGYYFTGATAVKFGDTPAASFTVDSDQKITAISPPGTAGAVAIQITALGGVNGVPLNFTYADGAAVTAVSPSGGPLAGGHTVILTGVGFTGATAVKFGSAAATSFTVNSDTRITAVSPAGSAGVVNVTVTTPSGTTAAGTLNQYEYVGAPTVTSVSPGIAPRNPSTLVTIRGTGFTSNSGVRFGTQNSSNVSVVSATELRAWTPPLVVSDHAETVDVIVMTDAGQSAPSGSARFTFDEPPSIMSFTPTGGAPGGGTSVDIMGGYFENVSSVKFGLAEATSFTIVDSTHIVAIAPPGTGEVQLSLTSPRGTSVAGDFAYADNYDEITPATLPAAAVGADYVQELSLVGATNPVTFSVESGQLPPGLALTTQTSSIAGRPTGGGDYTFTIKAQELGWGTQYRTYTLSVAAPTLAISPSALNAMVKGGSFSQTVSATGGIAPYAYAVSGGSLPDGLSLNGATGVISGAPSAAGAFEFTITSTDSSTGSGPYSISRVYSSVVGENAPVASGLSVSTAYGASLAIDLSSAISGVASTVAIGTGPSHGTAGVNGLIVTYQPAAGYNGTDSFTYTATGPGGVSGTATVNITVGGATLVIGAGPLADGTTEAPYSQTLSVSGGQAPYVFALQSGTLPQGLTLTSAGVISGTPTAAGASDFTVRVTDSSSGAGVASATKDFSIVIAQGEPVALPKAVTVNVTPGAGGSAIDLSDAVSNASGIEIVREPEHGTLTVSGFVVTYTPEPGYFGSDSFDFVALPVSDGSSARSMATAAAATSNAATVTITIAPPTLTLNPSELTQAQRDEAYSQTLTATGGTAPYAYAITAGALPAGLTLSAEGVLSGTPTVGGASAFTVTATDSSTGTGPFSISKSYTLQVTSVPVTAAPIEALTLQGRPVTVSLTDGADGGPYTAAALVSLSPADAGAVSIEETDGGGFALTFTSTGDFSGQAVATYTISNESGPSIPGTVTITVEARPDPGRDPDVRGVVAAQTDAALRFADIQIGNFGQRLESLHAGVPAPFHNGIGLTFGFEDARLADPWLQQQLDRERLMGLPEILTEHPVTARASAAGPNATGSSGHGEPSSIAVWVGGSIQFGRRDPGDGVPKFDFSSAGLSLGVDRRLSERFTLGGGLGVGESSVDVGSDGAKVEGRYSLGAIYGSFRPIEGAFVDGLIGYGRLEFDSRRTVAAGVFGPSTLYAQGERSGDQLVASVTAGWDAEYDATRLSPYGRLSSVTGALGAFAETGAGLGNLAYEKQAFRSLKLAIGVRAERRFEVGNGLLTPRARFEYQREFEGSEPAHVSYADWIDGPTYMILTDLFERDQVSLGVGAQYVRRRTTFGVDYQGVFAGDYSSQVSGQLSIEF